jgi:hypothetical protein
MTLTNGGLLLYNTADCVPGEEIGLSFSLKDSLLYKDLSSPDNVNTDRNAFIRGTGMLNMTAENNSITNMRVQFFRAG